MISNSLFHPKLVDLKLKIFICHNKPNPRTLVIIMCQHEPKLGLERVEKVEDFPCNQLTWVLFLAPPMVDPTKTARSTKPGACLDHCHMWPKPKFNRTKSPKACLEYWVILYQRLFQ